MSYLFTIRTGTGGEIEQFVSESPEFTVEINGVPVVGVHHTEDGGANVGIYPDHEHFQTLEVITMPGSKDVKDMGFDELLDATIPKVAGVSDRSMRRALEVAEREEAELIPLGDIRRDGCSCILLKAGEGWKVDRWNRNCKVHPQLEGTRFDHDVTKEELDDAKFPARHTYPPTPEGLAAFNAALAKGKSVMVQPGEVLTTKSGRELTHEDIEQMADEDEAWINERALSGIDLIAAEDSSGVGS